MAASDTLLSTGIGLQARLDAPARVFAMRQNEDIARKKLRAQQEAADQEALQKALSDYDLDPNKYHRLVQGDVISVTNDAINKIIDLKESGDPNWRNRVQREVAADWKNNIAHLSGLSTQYDAFEKGYNQTSNYRTKAQENLKKLMDESKTYDDFIYNAKRQNIGGLDTDSGLIVDNAINFDKAINLNAELDRNFSRVKGVRVNERMRPGPNGTTIMDYELAVPLTINDALDFQEKYKLPEAPISIEEVAMQNMNDPLFMAQFTDRNNIDPNDEEAIMNRMLEYGKEFTQRQARQSQFRPPTRISFNAGGGEDTSTREWSSSPSDIGTTSTIGAPGGLDNAKSLGSYGVEIRNFSPGRTSALVKFSIGSDGKPKAENLLEGVDPGKVTFVNMYVLPTKKSGNVLYPVIQDNDPLSISQYSVWAQLKDSRGNIYWMPGEAARLATNSQTDVSTPEKNRVDRAYREMGFAANAMQNHIAGARSAVNALPANATQEQKRQAYYDYINNKWLEIAD